MVAVDSATYGRVGNRVHPEEWSEEKQTVQLVQQRRVSNLIAGLL